MSHRITCHSNGFLVFPKECVCCGAEPQAIHTTRAFRAIDFILFSVGDETLITVPLCRRCYFLRSFFGPLLGMLLVMAAMGMPFILAVATLNPLLQQVYMFVSIVGLVLGLLYYRNWNEPIMDRLLAGISAGKLQKDRTFSLWLKREELIPQLSYSLEPRKYVETASYATSEERTHQQLNSWWAKCLFGVFFVLAAAMLYYEFSQIEAGRGRGATLPKLLLMIYKVIGKWPTCSLFGIPGLLGILWGAKQFTETKLLGAKEDAV